MLSMSRSFSSTDVVLCSKFVMGNNKISEKRSKSAICSAANFPVKLGYYDG